VAGVSPRVLFVDDDPNILAAYQRGLRRQFAIDTALGGEDALATIASSEPYAVVVSDQHMPGMDGVRLLALVRERSPDTARIMLTGAADQATAIAAVNEGAIFRFLCKPCLLEVVARAVEAGVREHRLATAERELIEKTLSGSVRMLMEILAAVDPISFASAKPMREMTRAMAVSLSLDDRWVIDLAAMLCHVGVVTVPATVTDRQRAGYALTGVERDMLDRVPETTSRLLRNIPRLEPVARIVLYAGKHFDGSGLPVDDVAGDAIPIGARILAIVRDLVVAETVGAKRRQAMATLREHAGRYDPALLNLAAQLFVPRLDPRLAEGQLVVAAQLNVGMLLKTDVVDAGGHILLAAGHELTAALIELLANYVRLGTIREPIAVINLHAL
jgi:response regulator RpfG family c-di-GMP phosphodiesterase